LLQLEHCNKIKLTKPRKQVIIKNRKHTCAAESHDGTDDGRLTVDVSAMGLGTMPEMQSAYKLFSTAGSMVL
jgi:hypothetical protein